MAQIVLYRPRPNVQVIEDQDHLNEILRAEQMESVLVENTPEDKQVYFDNFYVEKLTDLIGFDKQAIIKAAKKKGISLPVEEAAPVKEDKSASDIPMLNIQEPAKQ